MNKRGLVFSSLAVAMALTLLAVGTGIAAGLNTLTVSANVVGTCKFNSATSTLAFGALDPSSVADATATGSTTFWCTKGAIYTLSNDGGLNNSGGPRMKHAALAEFIPYALTLTPSAATGSGPSIPITLTIDGLISNADYVNASAGDYADTVVISVIP